MSNKKGSLINIMGYIVSFSFIAIIFLTMALLNIGIVNDYVLYEMQEISQTLNEDNLIKNETVEQTQLLGDTFTNFNFRLDDLFFLIYCSFVISTVSLSYQIKRQNHYGFLLYLFYGVMAVLFVLTIFTTLTNWWNTEILLKLLPNTVIYLPKFYYYLEHIGIFTSIHIVICLLTNLVDLDFSKDKLRKNQELTILEDNEIL